MKRIMIAAAVLLAGCNSSPASLSEVTDMQEVSITMTEVSEPTDTSPVKRTETEHTETERSERQTEPPQDVLVPEYIPADPDADAAIDIHLSASKDELLTDEDPEIIWSAMLPVECDPESVGLIDADTGVTVATLNDIADYKKYGGDIMGDGVYNCRFVVDTDINTDDDVSEQRKYHYYAEFSDEHGLHRSDAVEIAVYEPFTDKELEDMEAVDNVISDLLNDDDFKAQEKCVRMQRALDTLHTLSAEGTPERPYPLIIDDSICEEESAGIICYNYRCGIFGGLAVVPLGEGSTEPVR